MPEKNTDLVIVGGGAAGLMAGISAAELGVSALLLERKHRPGRKLLLCGNNRCNVTHSAAVPELLTAYGGGVAEFLAPALRAFPPEALRAWFNDRRLPTVAHKDGRVFPRSEKADDVLHVFTDALRAGGVPLTTNCPVQSLTEQGGLFRVTCARMEVRAPHVLLTTGGVSYPKTGSVGDGQKFAKSLGHRLVPYRPGLVGFELAETWLGRYAETAFPGALLRLVCGGRTVASTSGEILLTRWGARGPSMVDASRIVAREGLRDYVFRVDLAPQWSASELASRLASWSARGSGGLGVALERAGIPSRIRSEFSRRVLGLDMGRGGGRLPAAECSRIAAAVKDWELHPRRARPLKEAMVTMGGVSLAEVDSETMQSRLCPGLWFAGEVLDVDGPTGGYNLQAAFATARLAASSIARLLPSRERETRRAPVRRRGRGGGRRRQGRE